MNDPIESIERQLRLLSHEIGHKRNQNLPCDDLVARHRQLNADLRRRRTTSREALTLYTECLGDLDSEAIRGEWHDLLVASDTSSPAMSWEWQYAWRTLFAARQRVEAISVRESGTRRLVGLLPIVQVGPLRTSWRHEGYLLRPHLAPAGTRLGAEVDYTAPLLARDTDRPQVARLMVENLAERKLPFVANHWDSREESARLLVEEAGRLGFAMAAYPRQVAFAHLPPSLEEFIPSMPAETIRRKARRHIKAGHLEDGEFLLLTHTDPDIVLGQFPTLRRLNTATHGWLSIWRLPWYVEFLRQCVLLTAPRGWPVVWTLARGGAVLAAILGWLCQRTCYISAVTHDVAVRQLEPGHILLLRVIRQLMERGVECLDIHTAEGYKAQYFPGRGTRLDPLILASPGPQASRALAEVSCFMALRDTARRAMLRGRGHP
jgi:CelD/BcsL family acetyltransferase involved in cellulose biosynthesis